MATITLYSDYPFVQGGPHVPCFASVAQRDSFLNGLARLEFTNVDYEPRPGARLTLPIDYMSAKDYNYCKWTDGNKEEYFFIEDYSYLNDNPTTQLIISRDYWMTYHFSAVFQNLKIHRGHMPRWDGSTPIIYPIDEGNANSLYPANVTPLFKTNLGTAQGILLVTSKKIDNPKDAKRDGIFYWWTLGYLNGGRVPHPGGGWWFNPFNAEFVTDFAKFDIGLNVLVGGWVLPWAMDLKSGDGFISGVGTDVENNGNYLLANGIYYKTFNKSVTPTVKPRKNTAGTTYVSTSYYPQLYSDNLRPVYMTDAYGYPVMTIPKNILYSATTLPYYLWLNPRSMNPQVRFSAKYNTSRPADGLTAIFSGVPIDIPQSAYYDYVGQARAQDKSILENNIRSRYIQTAVSGIVGIAGGGASSYGYAQAYGGKSAVAGKAGVAGAVGGVASMGGSLINSYIQAQTDRDNFKMNEQKIKNTPTPPIAGDNPLTQTELGHCLVELQADDESIIQTFYQYHLYGYIVDRLVHFNPRNIGFRYWRYIQAVDANVNGPVTQDGRNYLAALLNRGVTCWNMTYWNEGGGFNAYNYDNPEV